MNKERSRKETQVGARQKKKKGKEIGKADDYKSKGLWHLRKGFRHGFSDVAKKGG